MRVAVCWLAIAIAGIAMPATADTACKGTLYLTLDTGSMSVAEAIADVMVRRQVKATFFMANEPTYRGDFALDESWAPYWKARAAEGHAFGSHTWRHWYFRGDVGADQTSYVAWGAKTGDVLDREATCREIASVGVRFSELTGLVLDPIWRAPGGRITPRALSWAASCGFPNHVGWTEAGFLGDELPSDKYSNADLLNRALKNVRDGDILMMHLGIRDRREPFALVFEPLIAGLQAKGFCFETLAGTRSVGMKSVTTTGAP